MDEIEYAIQGKVDNWRKERDFAYAIMLSSGNYKNPPSMYEVFPLPYDDEFTGKMSANEIEELYKQWEGKL